MFGPIYLDILTFFYPIGNTPAVCLTRDLPREGRGDILLLGCGDVRNILFTLYSEQNTSRVLDITCCDIQEAVIARNILLYSLALDTDGTNQQIIWNIYYHFYLDEPSLKVLNDQARKLVSLSTSISEWHETMYGRILRFCDSSTFTRVRALWKSYCMQDLEQEERTAFNRLLETNIQWARDVKAYYIGDGHSTTAIRSAAPIGFAYSEIAHELYQHYWKYGSTSQEPSILAVTTHPNPLFAYMPESSTLHYGTDPLLGFHLATAFMPLEKGSPFVLEPSRKSPSIKVVEAAQLQFRAWCNALRLSSLKALTIRFFAGDAMAFAHALHHFGVTGHGQSAGIYRDAYHLGPIKLDVEEYNSTKKAPSSFAVIDTSNLIDHLGAVSLLSATSSLLKNGMSSSLYTESLVRREKDYRTYIDSLLYGDFSTMSLLLDLFPVEYWTNASSSSTADDVMLDTVLRLTGADEGRQMRVKLTWKRLVSLQDAKAEVIERRLRFDETDLAHIFHNVYQNMFQHENVRLLFINLDKLKMKRSSILYCHRGSFVVFLHLVQSRVIVDWHELMDQTLRLIETDSTIMMGHSYIQELYLYLHILNLYSVEVFSQTGRVEAPNADGIRGWKDLPEVVCITLRVPRKALTALTGPKPTDIGTPIAHCLVESPSRSKIGRWQNVFSAVQIVFGAITTVGTRNSNDFTIQVTEDELRWKGNSPLVVSFNTPSWFLLLEPQTAVVAFALQSTPYSSAKFIRSLGVEMKVYETTLGNEDDVYVTRYSPNLTGTASIHSFSGDENKPTELSCQQFKTTITASAMRFKGRISSLTGRIDMLSDALKGALRSGCAVKTTQAAPCEFIITFTDKEICMLLHFPIPVVGNESKVRIARKSSYVEVEAPIHASAWITFPEFISPRLWDKAMIPSSPMHSLNMETLPVLHASRHSQLQWLVMHASGMFSGRERRLREQSMSAMSGSRPDARVSFKESLFSLFMHFTGVQGNQSRVFGLNNPTEGGVHILVFVSCMRLDMGSQTVVLDTAVLPLTTSLVPRIGRFLAAITKTGFCSIKVDSEELKLWRHILPSFAERCRDWQHRSSCSYTGKISQWIEDSNDVFCSCGQGSLPDDFIMDIPRWSDVAKFTTRAAISPIFSVPVADAPFDGMETSSSSILEGCRACGKREAADGGKLLKCSACHDAKYCSSSCQRADWKKHRRFCNK